MFSMFHLCTMWLQLLQWIWYTQYVFLLFSLRPLDALIFLWCFDEVSQLLLLANDSRGVNHVSHCKSRSPSSLTRSPLHLCSGHSLVMWSAVCRSPPHSHEADGASPIWFMLCFNLPYPVLIPLRRTSECRLISCPAGLFDGIVINSLSLQGVASHLLVHASFVQIADVFVQVQLLSPWCVVCVGHLLRQDELVRGIACFDGYLGALSQ